LLRTLVDNHVFRSFLDEVGTSTGANQGRNNPNARIKIWRFKNCIRVVIDWQQAFQKIEELIRFKAFEWQPRHPVRQVVSTD